MPIIAKYGGATLVPFALLVLGATVWGGFGVALLTAMSRERRRQREMETETDDRAARTGRPQGG